MTRRRKWILRTGIALVLLLLAGTAAVWWVLRTEWFSEQVRTRAIAELERATGGRAELGDFDFDSKTLVATIRKLVLHGKEAPDQPPLLTVEEALVDLKLVSMLRRDVDVEAIAIRQPRLNIIVYPDGSTNLPSPRERSKDPRPVTEVLLSLAASRLEVVDGLIVYDDRKIPLNLAARQVNARLLYEAKTPSYRGDLGISSLNLNAGDIRVENGRVDTTVSVEKDQLVFSKLDLGWRESTVQASGVLSNWKALRGRFDVKVTLPAADAVATFRAPIRPAGTLSAAGVATFETQPQFTYRFEGDLQGTGLALRKGGVSLDNIRASARMEASNSGLLIPQITVNAAGGKVEGDLKLQDWKTLDVRARLSGLALRKAAAVTDAGPMPWDGLLSGPVEFRGEIARGGMQNAEVRAQLNIGPAPDSAPVEGHAEVNWSQRSGLVKLGSTYFATPNTRIDVEGTLGQTVQVSARSSDLNDLLPLIRLAGGNESQTMPVTLRQSRAELTATVRGPLQNPVIEGRLNTGAFRVEGQDVDRLSADFTASRDFVRASRVSAARGSLVVEGQGSAGLNNWKAENGPLSGRFTIRGAGLAELARDFGSQAPVSGIADGTVVLGGTLRDPSAEADVSASKLAYEGEFFTNVRIRAAYDKPELVVTQATASYGPARLRLSGRYRHADQSMSAGEANFDAAWENLQLVQFRDRKWFPEDLKGSSAGSARGSVRVKGTDVAILSLNGEAALNGVQVGNEPVGALAVKAESSNNQLRLSVNGNVRESKIQGGGEWALVGSRTGSGQLSFSPISLLSLQRMRFPGAPKEDPQFEGSTEGDLTFQGSLNDFAAWSGVLTIKSLRINAKPEQMLRIGAEAQDLTFSTVGPVRVAIDRNGARIEKAELAGRNSRLTAAGSVAFGEKGQSDLSVKGNLNLAALQLFNPDLLARGMATVDATVRGAIADPQINGRLRLQRASLYVADVPTGIDNVNGTINFTRQRAAIEELAAEIGGGSVRLGGFLDFSGRQLGYRVTAQADNVRIRYPEDVSVTMDGLLTLTGTSLNSLVSGNITIVRASFQPKTDLGGMLAASSNPRSVPTTNEYLRGMQFDVRIESSQELRVTTSLTRELQVEAELRLRGSPVRPVLLGTVSVLQGQIQVFGNDYRVNRGEIRFFNPVQIEPVFDADLETKARGVTVNISFSGPLSRLNVTYRSDPPLQSREIIALLAVGRDPQALGSAVAPSSLGPQSSFLQTGANTLLGQAVSQQLSSRLQRFFGVSRIKIDPQLTGLDNLPQARLTLEQQISKEITLTYITNLNRAQEQIIRVQWDIDRNWSFLATRDGNGVFGVDFLFRKSFR